MLRSCANAVVVVDHAPQRVRLLVSDEVARVVDDRRRDIPNSGAAEAVRVRVDIGMVMITADVQERCRARWTGSGGNVVADVRRETSIQCEPGAQLVVIAVRVRVDLASLGGDPRRISGQDVVEEAEVRQLVALHEELGDMRHLVEREVKDLRASNHVVPRRDARDHGVYDYHACDVGERA